MFVFQIVFCDYVVSPFPHQVPTFNLEGKEPVSTQ